MKLTAEEFARFKPCSNYVLVKPDQGNHEIVLKSGAKLFLDTSFQKEKHAVTAGEVIRVPECLIFHDRESYGVTTLSYITQQELKPGFRVIFHYTESLDNLQRSRYIECDGEVYFLVKYDKIFLSMWQTPSNYTPEKILEVYRSTGDLIYENRETFITPINGIVIVEPVEVELPQTSLIIPDMLKGRKSETTGIIRYIGTPLRGYYDYPGERDTDSYHVGDLVYFKKLDSIPLQYQLHQAIDKDKVLYRMHRRDILGTFVTVEEEVMV